MKTAIKVGDIVEYEKWTGETVLCKVLRCEMGCVLHPLDGRQVRFTEMRKLKKVKGYKDVEICD